MMSQYFDRVLTFLSSTHHNSVGKHDKAVILRETYFYLYVWITSLRPYIVRFWVLKATQSCATFSSRRMVAK